MTLAELCVRRSVFAVMLVCFLAVLGIFSFRELGVDLFPRADPPTVNINIKLPGASPEEMTTQVALPLEEALSTISGVFMPAARTCLHTSTPLSPGIRRSTRMSAGLKASACWNPLLPSPARTGLKPSFSSINPMVSRRFPSSSITRTVCILRYSRF